MMTNGLANTPENRALSLNNKVPAPIGKPIHSLSLALAGSFLLIAHPTILSTLNTNTHFLGFILLNGSVIGLSTHLSFFLNQPKYNLLLKLNHLIQSQKIVFIAIAPGFIMGNIELTALGLASGIIAKNHFPQLQNIERKSIQLFQKTKKHLTREELQGLIFHSRVVVSRNKGRTLSALIGTSISIAIFLSHYDSQLNPIITNFNAGSYWIITLPGNFISNYITGGYLINSLLHAMAIGLNITSITLPLITSIVKNACLSVMLWDECRDTTSLIFRKTLEKFNQYKDFAKNKLSQTKRFFGKVKQNIFGLFSKKITNISDETVELAKDELKPCSADILPIKVDAELKILPLEVQASSIETQTLEEADKAAPLILNTYSRQTKEPEIYLTPINNLTLNNATSLKHN